MTVKIDLIKNGELIFFQVDGKTVAKAILPSADEAKNLMENGGEVVFKEGKITLNQDQIKDIAAKIYMSYM